ncbi:MAG: hypothetical protein CVU41_15895 [Chloroflexi bacterium HGW-Chloroflexi-3]|nr:MAG: hypothetical protein CVU41_15895 [Chloroflexi bacterium HGW-Chloroflexi-3]
MEFNKAKNSVELLPEGKFEFWRYLLLIIIIVGVTLVAQAIFLVLASLLEGTMDFNNFPPMTLLCVTMLPFAALLVFLAPGIRLLHQQSIISIFTQTPTFDWILLIKSGIIWFVLSGLADIIVSIMQPGNYVLSFSLFPFLPFMLLALILIAFQITAEEVLFRSYLLHGLTRLFRYRWLGIVLQAILFGVLHGANPEVTSYGLLTTMPFYIGIGLLLGWLSFKSKGLEIALGLHFANNFYATSMVTFSESAIPSPAIFTITNYQPEMGLVAFVIMAIIFTIIISKAIKNF